MDAPPASGGTASRAAPPWRRGPLSPGSFDFYVLSLSWSPSFCEGGGDRKSPAQCAPGRGLGFVVHGLWPQNQQGYPSNCPGARFPSRLVLNGLGDLYPDEGLARHEWRTHGTCSGLSPADYFAAVRQARDGVAVPQDLAPTAAGRPLATRDIARAFIDANRGLRLDTMAVTCRGGELAEVRLCLAKDLRSFVSCPEVARAACRSGRIAVPAPR